MPQTHRYKFLPALIFCVWALCFAPAFAADKALDAGLSTSVPVSLTRYFDVLEDPAQALTLADVQGAEFGSRFRADFTAGDDLNFGYTRSAYWLRFALQKC